MCLIKCRGAAVRDWKYLLIVLFPLFASLPGSTFHRKWHSPNARCRLVSLLAADLAWIGMILGCHVVPREAIAEVRTVCQRAKRLFLQWLDYDAVFFRPNYHVFDHIWWFLGYVGNAVQPCEHAL